MPFPTLHLMPHGPDRDAAFYSAARKGELAYSDIRTGGDAEWAANGLRDGLTFGNFTLASDREWANTMLRNLDCDFG